MATQNAQDRRSLNGVRLLAGVPQEVRDDIARHCRWQSYAREQKLIDREDDAADVFFLTEGQVRVVIFSASGREISFDDHGPGMVFGELSAIDGNLRSADVVALTDCTAALCSASTFRRIASESPALAQAMMAHLAGMVRRATERIMDLSTLAANNRVHSEILRLARPGIRDDMTAIMKPIPVHHDIATRVSTTRETVARVMGDLARTGLVIRQADHLLVTDIQKLMEIVEDVRGE